MKIVCAWCDRVIGGRGTDLSHGICKRCFDDLLQAQFDFMTALPPSPPAALRSTRGAHDARSSSRAAPPLQPGLTGF